MNITVLNISFVILDHGSVDVILCYMLDIYNIFRTRFSIMYQRPKRIILYALYNLTTSTQNYIIYVLHIVRIQKLK